MSVYVSVELRQRVRDAFGVCCAYCQTDESLTVTTFEIEHILPRSAGGATDFQNLCLACPACNRFKSDRAHVISEGHATKLFHPQQDTWLDHFDWSVDGTLVVGLTEVAQATINALRMNRPQAVNVRGLWVDAGRHPPK